MKPIFIIKVPSYVPIDNIKDIFKSLQDTIERDYHILILLDNTVKEWVFELYNVQNASEIEIEELKKIVLKNIEEIVYENQKLKASIF
jgi:hypothetical protein